MVSVSYEKKEHIAHIVVMNTELSDEIHPELLADLFQVIDEIKRDREIYVVILSGEMHAFEWKVPMIKLNNEFVELRVPVIAACSGVIRGGGYEFIKSCDILLGSDSVLFYPDFEKSQEIDAQTACKRKMINDIYEAGALLDAAVDLAKQICVNAQIAVQEIKKCVNIGLKTDLHTGLEFEQQAFALCNGTRDKSIGMQAYLNNEPEKQFEYQ